MSEGFTHFWREHRHFTLGVAATLILTLIVFFAQTATKDFMASVLNIQKAPAFDGTTLPLAQVPDWVRLASGESKAVASNIAASKWMTLPTYDPTIFGTVTVASLNTNNTADRAKIDTLMTYSTPYMGTYQSGSKEGDGSHLAVDIRTPIGTPVVAVANAVVEKIANNAPGFGNYVMLRHDNVPLLDSNETTTLYSTYAHLSKIGVAKGDIVYRGQIIGESGNSGTSTGAHLHFQIDRTYLSDSTTTKVPWHPWWPYSSADAAAAGVSFSDGVDAGLGKEAAQKSTVNPMLWVQNYLTTSPSQAPAVTVATAGTSDTTTPASTPTTSETTTTTASTETTTTTPTTTETPTETTHAAAPSYTYTLGGESFAMVGNTANVTLTAKLNGTTAATVTLDTPLSVSVTGGASVSPSTLSASNFTNGIATLRVTNSSAENVTLTVGSTSTAISFINQVTSISGFSVTTDGAFLIGGTEEITIQAVDAAGNPTPSSSIAGTVVLSTSTDRGTFTPATLTRDDFKDGRAIVQLTYPDDTSFTIKAQEGALLGTSKTVYPRLFTDVGSDDDYATAIAYLKSLNIVGGYPDGSFQPEKTVSRVEALKMILAGLDITLNPSADLTFPDTDGSAWYAPFVGRAVKLEIAKGYPDGTFGPAKTVNRAEYLKILVNAAGIEVGTPEVAPYDDVATTDWFAAFATYAKDKNLIPTHGNRLNASDGMTRGEVAETIYRLLVLKKTGASEYSDDLKM